MSKTWFLVKVQVTESFSTIYRLESEHSYGEPKFKLSPTWLRTRILVWNRNYVEHLLVPGSHKLSGKLRYLHKTNYSRSLLPRVAGKLSPRRRAEQKISLPPSAWGSAPLHNSGSLLLCFYREKLGKDLISSKLETSNAPQYQKALQHTGPYTAEHW